jgi:hypothetical protein
MLGVLYFRNYPCLFILILVLLKLVSTVVLFGSAFNTWRVDWCAQSPLGQFIKYCSFNFSCLECTSSVLIGRWDNVAVGLQDPLNQLVAFSLRRAVYTSKYFFVEGELAFILAEIAPLVPSILADIGDISFVSRCGGVGI